MTQSGQHLDTFPAVPARHLRTAALIRPSTLGAVLPEGTLPG